MENEDALIDEARNSLSEYCIKKCKAFCCRDGYLLLRGKEIEVVLQGKEKELAKQNVLSWDKDKACMLDMKAKPCPSLNNDFTCKIYTHESRPKLCKDYPLFANKDSVTTHPNCPAVKKGILDPYLKKLKEKGYKII